VGCLQKLANLLLSLVVLAAIALAGVYFFVLPQVDEKLADAVRREFILPPSSTVIIDRGSLLDTLEGQVHRFHVTSDELFGLCVEPLDSRELCLAVSGEKLLLIPGLTGACDSCQSRYFFSVASSAT